MSNLILVRLETVLVSKQYRCSVSRKTYHRIRNHFRRTRSNSSVMWVMWNVVSIRLETVLASVQDTCTVCATCRAQKSFWTHSMKLLGDVGHVESHFFSFGDSVSVGA